MRVTPVYAAACEACGLVGPIKVAAPPEDGYATPCRCGCVTARYVEVPDA